MKFEYEKIEFFTFCQLFQHSIGKSVCWPEWKLIFFYSTLIHRFICFNLGVKLIKLSRFNISLSFTHIKVL